MLVEIEINLLSTQKNCYKNGYDIRCERTLGGKNDYDDSN